MSQWTTDTKDLVSIAAWVVQTCLYFGTSVGTAHTVAGIFVDGLEREWQGPIAPKEEA